MTATLRRVVERADSLIRSPRREHHFAKILTSALRCVLFLFMRDEQPQDRAAIRQTLLGELAEIGMALARDLPRQAAEPEADVDAIALKYARISRAVRQTLALEARFEQDALDGTARATKQRGARCKREVERLVTRAIEAEFSEEAAEDLTSELDERLLGDLDDDYADAPPVLLAARICRDLGVPFDFAAWEDEDLAPPSCHPGFRAAEGRTPSAPAHSGASHPGLSRHPENAVLGDFPGMPAPPDGQDRPGDDPSDFEEVMGDWSPPRPSG
jgi:hypothetical protein